MIDCLVCKHSYANFRKHCPACGSTPIRVGRKTVTVNVQGGVQSIASRGAQRQEPRMHLTGVKGKITRVRHRNDKCIGTHNGKRFTAYLHENPLPWGHTK